MLVLLSSAAQPRYADDIVRALALPRGGQLQFRYDRGYIEPKLAARVPNEGLAGDAVLIGFLSAALQVVPVRFARVVRAEFVGSSCIFTLEATMFASGLDDASLRAAIGTAEEHIPVAVGDPPKLQGLFAFSARASLGASPSLGAFEATAAALAKHSPFAAAAFFHIYRVSPLGRYSWFGTWPRPLELHRGAYPLISGRRYECEAYCLAQGVLGKPLALAIDSDDEAITFTSAKRSAIDSRYDIKRFTFATEPRVETHVSGLRLQIVEIADDEVEGRCEIVLPLVFGGRWWVGLLRAAAVGIGTAGPAMVGANAAGKLNVGVALVMIALGAVAGLGTVFWTFRKP